MKVSESNQNLILKIVMFVVLYLIFAKPVLNYLGITKSAGDRVLQKEDADPNSPFKPNFWAKYIYLPASMGGIAVSGAVQATPALMTRVVAAAEAIFFAMGYMTDDEAEITQAFASMQSQAETSLMAYYFGSQYKVDLLTYLHNGKDLMPQNGLGDYDVLTIINFVKRLPIKPKA